MRLIVADDNVGMIGRTDRVKVELLRGSVAAAEASLDVDGGSVERHVSSASSGDCLLEPGGHEDPQVPSVDQLGTHQEHALKDQHGIDRCDCHRLGHGAVGLLVVNRPLKASVSARTKRIKQDPAERVVIKAVVIAALGGQLATSIPLCPREKETLDRRSDHTSPLRAQGIAELVGKRGLAGRGRPIDRNPQRMRDRNGLDHRQHPTKELTAGACIHRVRYLLSPRVHVSQSAACRSREGLEPLTRRRSGIACGVLEGRAPMPKYMITASYTTKGLEGVRAAGAKSRVDAVSAMLEAVGGHLDSFHFAFGDADVFAMVDLPDDEAAAAVAIAINSSGAVSIHTTKLLTVEQVDDALRRAVDYQPPGS
jgi:uncharacterized protein with GYD domain